MIMPSELFRPEFSPGNGIFQLHQRDAFRSEGHTANILSCGFISTRDLLKKLSCTDKDHDIIFWLPAIIPLRVFPKRLIGWFHFTLNFAGFLIYLIKHGKPDVIHAHNLNYAGYSACKIGNLFNIKVALTEHNTRWHIAEINIDYVSRFSKTVKCLPYLSTVGISTAKILGKAFDREWQIIPNVCQLDVFTIKPAVPTNNELNEFTNWVNSKHKVLLNVGGLRQVKQQSELIKEFHKKQLFKLNYKLAIVGTGPLLADLTELVSTLGLHESVIFLGERIQTEINYLMANSYALIIASEIETFGVVAIEALASGCPVITTTCGGPEQIIKPPEHGYILRARDLSDLAQALDTMQEYEFRPNTMRSYVQKHFSPSAFVKRFIEITQLGAKDV